MEICSLNLSNLDQDLLDEFLADKKKIVIFKNYQDLDSLMNYAAQTDNISEFFCVIDEDTKTEKLEEFLSRFVNHTLNIILKGKLFDHLLICQRYEVNYVFLRRLDKGSLEAAYFKKKYLKKEHENEFGSLPLNITSLYARAIKIKNSMELFNSLNRYLSSHRGVKKFSYLVVGESNKSFGAKLNKTIIDKITSLSWSKKYIGMKEYLSNKNEEISQVVLPTWLQDDGREFVYLEVDKKQEKSILNDYFFNYLENVLIYRNNKSKEQKLKELVNLDEVTGAFNSRKLMEDLARQINKHKLKQEKFCVLFLDIDHFKKVNDQYGHLVGSKLLVDLAAFLKYQLRETDLIYRYGGDEFVVIMPFLDTQVVSIVAERLLNKVKSHSFEIDSETTYKMSVSIGISEYPTDALSEKEIIKFADEMMYKSKNSGRGKVFYLNKASG